MKYLVVRGSGSDLFTATSDLVEEVNELCSDNWKPQGGISITSLQLKYLEHYEVAQAMVKED